ncbi:MAG: glycoside hydrolase family 2 TIM barrel-domain containing protein [Chthoniobacteraceae bacterium]
MNGTPAGTIPGYGGEVDISKRIRYGASNTLRLFFPREGGATLASDQWASKVIPTLPLAKRSEVGVLGMPDTVYVERQPRDILVSDVWYRTFTRNGTRVEPRITVQADHSYPGVRVHVTLYDLAQPMASVNTDFNLGDIPEGESTHTLSIPGDPLKLWSLREPNLYCGQVVLTDASGKELDRSTPVRFGVREFWLQGKDYYMNNQRINFTLDAYLFPELKDALNAGVTLTFAKHAANGVNLLHDNEDWSRQCDQLGMGFVSYGVGVGYDSPNLTNPEILAAYRTWVEAHTRNLRNHPSILFWVLSTNMMGGDTFNPATIGRSAFMRRDHALAGASYAEQRKADDTRPSFHHQSVGTGDLDTGNVYFNHLPTQSVEDWMSAWKESGDRPYMLIEYMGTPLEVDYVKGYTLPPLVSYATEYAARLAGERAYKEETAAYMDYSNHEVPRIKQTWDYYPMGYSPLLMEQLRKNIPQTYRTCRYYGVPADLWVFPMNPKKFASKDDPRLVANKELVQIATDVLKPDCFWIGGPAEEWTSKAHQFQSGDTITKSVLCVEDQPWQNQITVKWEARLSRAGTVIASGTETTLVAPWSSSAVQFQFKAPENSSATPLPLEIRASVSGTKGLPETACEPFFCTVWPREESPAPGKAVLSIIDPEGETTVWLQKAGAQVQPFQQGKTKAQTLIIGRRALHGLEKLPFTAEDIHEGMRVLICEQYCGDLEKLGFRTEDHCPRNVFAGCADHPILAGLADDALRDWNGNATLLPWGPEGDTTHTANSRRSYHWSNRGTVASDIVETPHFGPFKAITDCEFDLAYSPLLSWRHGAGEVIFSQLDITGRTESDPAVERLHHNLVRYFQAPLEKSVQNRIAVCASDKTYEQIAAMGFAAKQWEDAPNPAENIMVFGKEDLARWPKLRDKALAFANNGGDVLIFPAAGDLFSDPAFKGLSLKPWRTNKAGDAVDRDRLLNGIGLQNIHWREPIDFLKIESTEASTFKSLLGGLAGRLPMGKGQFIFFQVTPEAFGNYAAVMDEDTRLRKAEEKPLTLAWYSKDRKRSVWQTHRLDALLLANLGLESSPALVKAIFEAKAKMPFYPVDKWMLLGPIPPPSDPNADPVAADFSPLLKERVFEKPVQLSSGQSIPWYAPNDFNNGLGIAGMVDLGKPYGVKLKQTALAITYLWSSRDRVATLQFGADWWLKIQLNGKEIFRTGSDVLSHAGNKFAPDFGFTVKAPLQKGWNEVVCAVGAGSGSNAFWFRVSNPGDVIEEQSIVPPKDTPNLFLRYAAGGKYGKMSAAELEESENAPAGFSLYTEPLTVTDDPYLYMRW